jgi:hypothetical protein
MHWRENSGKLDQCPSYHDAPCPFDCGTHRNLIRELLLHSWIIPHDIGVTRIGHENKLAHRERLEHLQQPDLSDRYDLVEGGKVEWTIVERPERILGKGEGFVCARDLLW